MRIPEDNASSKNVRTKKELYHQTIGENVIVFLKEWVFPIPVLSDAPTLGKDGEFLPVVDPYQNDKHFGPFLDPINQIELILGRIQDILKSPGSPTTDEDLKDIESQLLLGGLQKAAP